MDVTTATFEAEVLEASKAAPVVVDFWAPWCGPCRTLGPIIEKVAADYAGRVKLVKVDSDANPELSAAYGIRSIPNVIAFRDGRPAAQFLGAVPEREVRAFFDKLLPSAEEAAILAAEAMVKEGRLDDAEQALAQLRLLDPELETRVGALRHAIGFARADSGDARIVELQQRLSADPNDHEARLELASVAAARESYAEAMDALLEIIRRAKNWRDGEARRQFVSILSLAGKEPQLVAEYRRKLAAALH